MGIAIDNAVKKLKGISKKDIGREKVKDKSL